MGKTATRAPRTAQTPESRFHKLHQAILRAKLALHPGHPAQLHLTQAQMSIEAASANAVHDTRLNQTAKGLLGEAIGESFEGR